MPAAPLLALLLLTAPGAGPEGATAGGTDAPGALAGCRAERVPEHGWKLRCGGLVARVEDRDGTDLTRLRAVSERWVAEAFGEGLEKWAEHRVLAGREVQVRRFHSPAKGRTAWTAALPLAEGTRLLTCEGAAVEARCAGVLEALALMAWRAEPGAGAQSVGERPLLLATQVVKVPAGCTGEVIEPGGGHIKCGDHHSLTWWMVADPAEGARRVAEFDARMERVHGLGYGPWDHQVACRLAGVATTCARWFGERDGQREVALAATVLVDGRAAFAKCLARTEPGPGAPCRALFQVHGSGARREAATEPTPAEEYTEPEP